MPSRIAVGGLVVFVAWSLITAPVAWAFTCNVSLSPTVVANGSVTGITYQLTNQGPEIITGVKIESGDPAVFEIRGGEASGFSVSFDSGSITYSGGSLAASQGAGFNFTVAALQESGPVSMDFFATSDGSTFEGCDGAGNLETGEVLQPPVISGLAVSASSTSATVTWTTDVAATSTVNYGLTASYGSSQSGSGAALSHSFTLSSLSSSTTYYYKVTSTNSNGTREASGSFVTGAAGTTTTTTTTVATTTTAAKATPTPTPKVDRTPPAVSVTTEFTKPFEKAPQIVGKASDDEELSSVEYSVDGGVNWLPVDEFDGKGEKKGAFSFTPQIREDGNYELVVRATDKTGNVGKTKGLNLVIDRLPPRVGGALWSVGPFALTPGVDGVVVTMSGIPVRVTMSAVGGPVEVKMTVGDTEYELERSTDTGLWSTTLKFDAPGEYGLEVKAVDGADNITKRSYGKFVVLEPGKVREAEGNTAIGRGSVELFWKDPESGVWTSWDGNTFGQENPIALDETGEYKLLVPVGTYYLEVRASGFKTLRSRIFNVDKIGPINVNLVLNKSKTVKIGPWEWDWFGFYVDVVDLNLGKSRGKVLSDLMGERAPIFSLPSTVGKFDLTDLRGEPAVVSFVNTWSPTGSEQISVLDALLYSREMGGLIVVPQESLAGVKVFTRRGGYKSGLAVDADGDFVEKYDLTTLPTHYLLDRNGVVVAKMVGVLSRDELLSAVKEIR